ncbi:hypothetical protein C482_13790 [Natrialba chahannaoensis JCM 10990]|uniref:DUF418 domain-containing protein n=1 Tax=Natrialba chahannaoensis JCM 10990 TaxID=1227492 RepID=M0AEX6_9EURY|nr:DUF418 domain-containing protein [Natrialba chahannaoensis]ELY97310.1 hypothetical protein C482_13790 [Natrialba chahannaoensis JCM 10990]
MSKRAEDGPTPPSERIVALDALRGVALLGILLVNIWLFSMPEASLSNPTVHGDFTGGNYWAWFGTHVFAQQKFITLFTLLFGAGIILFTQSARSKSTEHVAAVLSARRFGWLVLFGLAHAYLLWYGDILVAYGACAFGVLVLRDLPARTLTTIGIGLIAVPSLIEVLAALTADPSAVADTWRPTESVLRAEIETYRSGWIEQFDHRASTSFRRQTTDFVGYTAWRVGGVMLLGMALFKWGVMTNERSAQFYARLAVGGAVSGLAVILAGVAYIHAHDWGVEGALLWRQFNYWGSLPLAAAYLALVMWYCKWRPDSLATRWFAAVGRTAFSNYLLQTVLATSIFYGHGLGLFGAVTRVELLAIVVAIWAVQVPLSVLWLRYFRYGPIEWLWRALTYRSMPPLRVSSGGSESAEKRNG